MSWASAVAHWIGLGLRDTLAMAWLTWWPLVLGFSLAGLLQSAVTRDTLRRHLGPTTPSSLAKASLLGAISSSCSYAASATARALFARGASWTNAMVFMVASTNLVIELGIVLYVLLGWRFVLAQAVGGAIMIVLLAGLSQMVFRPARTEHLRARLSDGEASSDEPIEEHPHARSRRETLAGAARYAMGDLTMIKFELAAGFLLAGFASAHVPASWWSHLFLDGHGPWTVLENVLLAPLVAALACVCSVGNIPLAAALWGHGVAFGGVVAFVFADLMALPLLAIYRRFYGATDAWRLWAVLWGAISLAGLGVDGLFRLAGLTPHDHRVAVLSGRFPLGATLVLNVLAALVMAAWWWLARVGPATGRVATDPVCGMAVERAAPAARARRGGQTYYFCSPGCRDRFLERAGGDRDLPIDPV